LIIFLFGTWAFMRIDNQIKQKELSNLRLRLQIAQEGQILPNSAILAPLVGTPMEDSIPYIIKAADYYDLPLEIYLGIASAESSFKNYNCYNPWGIGYPEPRCYNDWEHSADGFSQLMRHHYFNLGYITPEELLPRYVGWDNQDWLINVKQYYYENN
jgi:hypothetical protein